MKKRIITALVIAFILIPLLLVKALFPLLQWVIILFCVVATIEMINMCEKKRKIPLPIKIIIIISTVLIYIGIVNEDPSCTNSVITLMMQKIDFKLSIITTLTIACATIFACQVFIEDFNAADVGYSLMIVFYVALGFSSITILLFNGMRFVVYLVTICVFTDIFALVFGLKFGKRKLCPHISPKKTVEGAIGGTICGTLAGSFFTIFYNQFGHFFVANGEPIKFFDNVIDYNSMPKVALIFILIFLSFLLSLSSQIGDLICSRFKRTYEIKDFSQVFPGHGGILDRFDSVLFSGIVFLCFITIIRVILPVVGM